MRRLLLGTVLLWSLLVLAQASASPQARPTGSWVGRYALGGSDEIAFSIEGSRAVVALGAGHAGAQSVPVSVRGGRVRFQLPGRPAPVVFSGRLRGAAIEGTVVQGKLRGAFDARRGGAPGLVARGWYTAPNS